MFFRAVCGPEGRFGAVIVGGVFDGGSVSPAIRFGVGTETLGDKTSRISIEVAYIG